MAIQTQLTTAINGMDVVDADASGDEIAALVAQSQKRSAIFDIITNPGNVRVAVK